MATNKAKQATKTSVVVNRSKAAFHAAKRELVAAGPGMKSAAIGTGQAVIGLTVLGAGLALVSTVYTKLTSLTG